MPRPPARPENRIMTVKYGVLSYGTVNIGDEIQSIAAMQFLPRVDAYINRERLNTFRPASGDTYMMIMNGWHMHQPRNWPPSANIKPLLISMHLTGVKSYDGIIPYERLLSGKNRAYFTQHAPVGARDLETLGHLQRAGIPSYFSGCLSLTLHCPDVPRQHDLIVLNDVPSETEQIVRRRSAKKIETVSQMTNERDRQKRFAMACKLLETYARASLVVTSRLHCALPCLAFGTPVILITSAADLTRFPGLAELTEHYAADEFCTAFSSSMIDRPRPVSTEHHAMRDTLIRTVTEFIGEDFYRDRVFDYRRFDRDDQSADVDRNIGRGSAFAALYRKILGRRRPGAV